ncbi:Hypothetical predicted protein [Olea europaea subsp. europaea]|uniref:Uncharacterized protein n=1 Tax=Olea europaea subsp. europaea TaxID=158383 RepID=A0A8S0VGV0_OLEEU|nr:Hypothetical predicted protein [Olea europaea subsp. europaea]
MKGSLGWNTHSLTDPFSGHSTSPAVRLRPSAASSQNLCEVGRSLQRLLLLVTVDRTRRLEVCVILTHLHNCKARVRSPPVCSSCAFIGGGGAAAASVGAAEEKKEEKEESDEDMGFPLFD